MFHFQITESGFISKFKLLNFVSYCQLTDTFHLEVSCFLLNYDQSFKILHIQRAGSYQSSQLYVILLLKFLFWLQDTFTLEIPRFLLSIITKISNFADIESGVGRYLMHLRGTQRLSQVDTHRLMMSQLSLPLQETRWRPSSWERHSNTSTCYSQTTT